MADYQYVQTTGVVVPDTSTTQAQVESEWKAAFGQNLIVTPNTPQGVMIAAEVTARQAVARNNAQLANQVNPEQAGGVFLDAILKLTGGARKTATKSVAPAVALTGQPGTLVPAGSLAQTAAGDQFASAADVTLSATGTGVVDFIAVTAGPVPAAVGALTSIVSAVLGWETVTNPTAATLGVTGETDAALRFRRRQSLALQGASPAEAVRSGLYATPGVRSLQFRENYTSAPATIDGIVMPANSMYACVDGGADADVAATILARKTLGTAMVGTTTVNVVGTSGQSYAVQFARPTQVPVVARVTVKNVAATGDPATLVQNALLAYAAGQMASEPGFTVGSSVSPFELAAAIGAQSPGLYVQKVEVSLASAIVWQTTELALSINQIATLLASGITVVVL